MTQSQVLDMLDMQREMILILRKILERLEQPAPTAAVTNWQAWENFRNAPAAVETPK